MARKTVQKTARKRPGLKTEAQKRQFESAQRNGIVVKDVLPERPTWAKFLTDREYMFVREYLVDFKAGAAAHRAGIGETDASSASMASSLRRLPHVAQAIDAAMAGSEGGSARTRIVEELAAIAFSNPRKALEAKSREELALLTDEEFLAVKKVKQVKGKNPSFEVETADKLGALDKLGRATGLFSEEKAGANVAVQVIIHQRDAGLL